MKFLKKILMILVLALIVVLILISFFRRANLKPVKAQLDEIDLSNYNKVMVVAHPDDETLWGGAHLLEDNYLVVCVSCGRDELRDLKFEKALSISKDSFVRLGFSDKYLIKRDYRKLTKALKKVFKYKKWDMVVTHNPEGEYGNLEHKQVSEIVTKLKPNNLNYFGKYYSSKKISELDLETSIDGDLVSIKVNKMVKAYNDDSLYKHKHMFSYENWVSSNSFK